VFPDAVRAQAQPASVRPARARSNSANALNMCICKRPAAVERSSPSRTDTKATPR
jgi:hypothetical protein